MDTRIVFEKHTDTFHIALIHDVHGDADRFVETSKKRRGTLGEYVVYETVVVLHAKIVYNVNGSTCAATYNGMNE